MPYLISGPCIDVKDMSCVDECPVDCIYEGGRKLYIQPAECIDCGACEPVCPVDAIHLAGRVPPGEAVHVEDNRAFFDQSLPGRDVPLGSPGGARRIGPIETDTELVASMVNTG